MILANEGYIAKMAILGMSSSNFYKAQNTVSVCQITLEIKKKQPIFKVFIKKFFDYCAPKKFSGGIFLSRFFWVFSLANPV